MRVHRIAVIPGGGADAVRESLATLDRLAEVGGGVRFAVETLNRADGLTEDDLTRLADVAAILTGGDPAGAEPDAPGSARATIRARHDLYVNLQPVRRLPGLPSRLAGQAADLDLLIVRENSEGEGVGAGGRVHPGTPHEIVMQEIVFTREGVERVIRYAFELAAGRGRRLVSSVSQGQVMAYATTFWEEIFALVAAEYPALASERMLGGALAARLVTDPSTLDVVVAPNLFGDVLTELGGALVGGAGVAPSADLNPSGAAPALFGPARGVASAGPLATLWAGQMLLDHLGETRLADLLLRAVEATTGAGGGLTPDLGGTATTAEVGQAVRVHCERLAAG